MFSLFSFFSFGWLHDSQHRANHDGVTESPNINSSCSFIWAESYQVSCNQSLKSQTCQRKQPENLCGCNFNHQFVACFPTLVKFLFLWFFMISGQTDISSRVSIFPIQCIGTIFTSSNTDTSNDLFWLSSPSNDILTTFLYKD